MNGQNHLAGQTSPYLLQHAGNPVDWYPWGPEALEKAIAEDKFLIVSVGYAACHWCHVMEHESFEDTTVAAFMNEHFVSVKVDREERPDVDEVYMTACQLSNRRGCGWPLNAVALPDGRPIWAGTYFPRDQWLGILNNFVEEREKNPDKMVEYAARLGDAMDEMNRFQPAAASVAEKIEASTLDRLAEDLLNEFDFRRGGIRGEPKFPMPILHEFLLTYHHYTGNERALEAVATTLDAMASGGIYDQLEGGFARYSTDADWKVPHFEKMLYDNAQLVSLYAKAYQLTGRESYARVIRQTLDFIDAKLTNVRDVLFYTSLDADTEGEEGKTYLWSKAEIEAVLGDSELAATVTEVYNVNETGNWEGYNILYRTQSLEKIAQKAGYATVAALEVDLEAAGKKLLAARNRRPQPALDDKTLTAWNALMVTAYVDAYRALGDEAYRDRAVAVARSLTEKVLAADGGTYRNFKNGQASITGFLDDAALLANGYFEVYQITFDASWLDLTGRIVRHVNEHYFNADAGLYNYTSRLDPPLAGPNIPIADGVIPGGNSLMARLLYRYGTLSGNEELTERARALFATVLPRLEKDGARSYANWSLLALELFHPTYEIAIVGPEAPALRKEMSRTYLPNAILLGSEEESELPLLHNKFVPGETFVYVCYNKSCRLPVREVGAALAQLE